MDEKDVSIVLSELQKAKEVMNDRLGKYLEVEPNEPVKRQWYEHRIKVLDEALDRIFKEWM